MSRDIGREIAEALGGHRESKEVTIGITFKQVTLDLTPQQFSGLVEDTAAAFKQRVIALYETQRATKVAALGGDPLQTKGVNLIVGGSF